ncbi:molybdenum cofactor guanylyltransferase [Tunturibacter empetritectus]|uniref:Probable molybdenum cofactor guanylyltransferase n=1 Tax=Tunturiibacter lichenicola TaxID=2051959 RepID=A0A7W8J7Y1_9BACT|nr:molybdenum cofactor guanylyltransferase [Edaphobacter lichenicola]MBB5344188.1 molybdopterin-guanine dinucleotide biosynthesis protein A [Edaphobacter lichenicola]
MQREDLPPVGGYVLAGGKSSRMGSDKALLELAGKTLALHATTKLRRVCAEVSILGNDPALERFAPLVRDLHPGCGPIGGIEASFRHSRHEWNLYMPVDMPFFPSVLLSSFIAFSGVLSKIRGTRVALFTVFGTPQPLFCLLHRDVAPFVYEAVERGQYKVFPVLENAGEELAERQRLPLHQVFFNLPWGEESSVSVYPGPGNDDLERWEMLTEAQQAAKHLWFANLNTPEEFVEAERHVDALDT